MVAFQFAENKLDVSTLLRWGVFLTSSLSFVVGRPFRHLFRWYIRIGKLMSIWSLPHNVRRRRQLEVFYFAPKRWWDNELIIIIIWITGGVWWLPLNRRRLFSCILQKKMVKTSPESLSGSISCSPWLHQSTKIFKRTQYYGLVVVVVCCCWNSCRCCWNCCCYRLRLIL